jgi:hypothetical protein
MIDPGLAILSCRLHIHGHSPGVRHTDPCAQDALVCPQISSADSDMSLCKAIAQTVGQPMEWKIPQ